eukprot:759986-Alexandrium_andersonii.AAC.1
MGIAPAMTLCPHEPFWGRGMADERGPSRALGVDAVLPEDGVLDELRRACPGLPLDCTMRQALAHARGPTPNEWPAVPRKVCGAPPSAPNAFTDGSLKYPTSTYASVGGSGG